MVVLLSRAMVDMELATSSPQLSTASLGRVVCRTVTLRKGLERNSNLTRCEDTELVGGGTEYTALVLVGVGGAYLIVRTCVDLMELGGVEGRMEGEMASKARLLDVTTSGKIATTPGADEIAESSVSCSFACLT